MRRMMTTTMTTMTTMKICDDMRLNKRLNLEQKILFQFTEQLKSNNN